MKKQSIKFLITVIFSMISCKSDFLDLANPNVQTSESYWKTEDDALKGVNAIYQGLYYDGTFLRFAQCALDFRGDDTMSPSTWDVMSNTGSFKLFNNTIMQEWLWTAFFGGVNRANLVLDNIENIPFKDQNYKNRLKGEALYLRALNNFYLVSFFNNIPLILKSYKNSGEYFHSQATPEETWTQVMKDFDDASKLLPSGYSNADLGRATKGAALAFLGKSYLFNKRYAEAALKFKEVIDSKIYNLVSNYGENFTESGENNPESIFEVQFSREAGGTTIGWVDVPNADWSKTTARAVTYAPAPFGWNDAAPTKWIFEEFKKEKTIEDQVDPRLKVSIYYNYPDCKLYGQSFQQVYANEPDKLGMKKYGNGDSGVIDEKDWRSGINERLMRYSDVLLMYAECLNELGNTGLCADYIQKVRNRVKLPDRSTEFAGFTQAQMREQLSHERALEFAFEGHRFDDIHRWGWLKDPLKLTELKQHDAEFNSYVQGREFFSIPQAEIQVNPNLRQNPGY